MSGEKIFDMDRFERLKNVVAGLHAEDGRPWDRQQKMHLMRQRN